MFVFVIVPSIICWNQDRKLNRVLFEFLGVTFDSPEGISGVSQMESQLGRRTDIYRELDFHTTGSEEIDPDDDPHFRNGVMMIGCSGMDVSLRNKLISFRGGAFDHQVPANSLLADGSDLLSALEYALEENGVQDVVICGHEDCQFIRESLDVEQQQSDDPVMRELAQLRDYYQDELSQLPDRQERAEKITRLNVKCQVEFLARASLLRDRLNEDCSVDIHGWYWSDSDGGFHDLRVGKRIDID